MNPVFQWPSRRPLIMGVLNVTPDSFSDGGLFADTRSAIEHGLGMLAAGADIIDVGGESSRPGAAMVSPGEEIERVVPVIKELVNRTPTVCVSVDTTKAAVAEAALNAGARIVNDISAMRFDTGMAEVVRRHRAGIVLMHMQGTPQTMQDNPSYEDVVGEVVAFLAERIAAAESAGIQRPQIAVDPGFGFGKTVAHNVTLLANLDRLRRLGLPILVGTSRKSFVGNMLGRPDPRDRIWGVAATVGWAFTRGATAVRVHDVAQMRDVALMTTALMEARELDTNRT